MEEYNTLKPVSLQEKASSWKSQIYAGGGEANPGIPCLERRQNTCGEKVSRKKKTRPYANPPLKKLPR